MDLEKARGRQGLLEEVERVVIVEDLDRLLDRDELLRAALHARVVVRLGRRAALLELGSELLVLTKRLLRILEVVLQVHDLDGGLPGALGLGPMVFL